jgi:hypothetical protein
MCIRAEQGKGAKTATCWCRPQSWRVRAMSGFVFGLGVGMLIGLAMERSRKH